MRLLCSCYSQCTCHRFDFLRAVSIHSKPNQPRSSLPPRTNPSILPAVRLAPWLATSLASCLLLVGPGALADDVQTARFRLDALQPASALSPFFSVEGPVRSNGDVRDRFGIALLASYARSPLTVYAQSDGDRHRLGTPVANAVFAHLVGTAALTDNVFLDLAMPLTLVQTGHDVVFGTTRVDAPNRAAIGDMRLGALWRGALSSRLGWLAGLRAWAPTGDKDAYASDGRFRAELLAGGTLRTGRTQAACTIGGSPTFVAPRAGDRLYVGCAASVLSIAGGPWLGGGAVANALRIDRNISTGSEVELWATAHQPAGPFRMGLGAGPGFGSSPGTPVFRAMATFAWVPSAKSAPPLQAAPQPPDPDMDGIRGALDACPQEAGPPSPDPSQNGCPHKDTDGDGIEDRLDDCPTQAGMASDVKGSNGCPDRDNDHVADVHDACPDEPGRASDDPKLSGCPKRARLRGDRFVIDPPLTAASDHPDTAADDEALWEIAYALRSAPQIRKVAIEVRLQAPEQDIDAAADRAIAIANDLVKRLVDLGVDRSRLDPVGAIADTPGVVVRVVESADAAPHR